MKNRNKKIICLILVFLISINTTALLTSSKKSTYGTCYLSDGEVTPTVGKKGTMFTYWVKYFDPDGTKPTIKQVQIIRPNGIQVNFDMQYFGGSCKKEGAVYYFPALYREKGEFKFKFYFENKDGEVAHLPDNENEYFTGPTVITKAEHYAVIVSGGVEDDLQDCFERTSDLAYDTFESLGYDDDHIYYLSRDTSNPRVDEKVTHDSVKYALTNWLEQHSNEESKCFLYFCDHGSEWGSFIIDENEWINDYEIARWLKNVRYKTLTIVMECCFSGQFIDDLSGYNRIVITSTNEILSAYGSIYGYALFSEPFFNALRNGASYGEAWEEADKKIAETLPDENTRPMFSIISEIDNTKNKMKICDNNNQIPLIDDNGDGIGHGTSSQDALPLSGDGNLALDTYPGYDHDNSKEKNSLREKLPFVKNILKMIPLLYKILEIFF